MTVYFYTFGKRYNSTKQPTGGTSYDCKLIQPSGVLNPSITLDLGATGNPTAYNYAYISDYGRYYWVDEWTSNLGFWTARLSVDPLASWKSYIGDTTCMVLRSSDTWDDDLIDTLYPTKSDPNITVTSLGRPWTTPDLSSGRYVLGIAGNNTTFFYSMTQSQYNAFISDVFDLTWLDNMLGGSNVLNQVPWMRGVFNPLQFITSCIWIPFVPSGTAVSTIPIGVTSVTASATQISTPVQLVTNYTPTLSIHPQVSSRGDWLKNEPYTHRTLFVPPFGNVTLPAEFLYASAAITATIRVDVITGQTRLLVLGPAIGGEYPVLTDLESSVAVPVLTTNTSVSQNLLQSAAGLGIGLGEGIAGLFTGNISGLLRNVTSLPANVASAVLSQVGTITTTGSVGSAIGILPEAKLTETFWLVSDSAAADRGRPLCQLKGINTLTGYIQVLDGEFPIPCTDQELRAIKTFTEGGFFYE